MIELHSRPKRLRGLLDKDLGDEYLFYDAGQECVHVLNSTAREIYLLCSGSASVAQIVGVIVARYGINETVAQQDVEKTLARLVELGLVGLN